MCVVLVVQSEKVRPGPGMIEAAWASNPSGGGCAWRDTESGEVKWAKGLNLIEMQHYGEQLAPPFVLHFRIPSAGGSSNTLCHPFTVDEEASVEYEGSTKGSVLFHNGTWSKWRDVILDMTLRHRLVLPTGKWSDTRAMAYLAGHLGIGFLEFLDEKVVVFTPDDIVFFGTWKLIDGVYCSNDYFDRHDCYRKERDEKKGIITSFGGVTSYYRTPPASIANHHRACGCTVCSDLRNAERSALLLSPVKEVPPGAAPLAQGETSEALPLSQRMLVTMSKKSLKRLRKKQRIRPKDVTLLEQEVLTLAAERDTHRIMRTWHPTGLVS